MNVEVDKSESYRLTLNNMTREQAEYLLDVVQNNVRGTHPDDESAELREFRTKVFNALKQQLTS